ncbi:MAG: deoxyhypusine synthase, partial [Tolypothrix sp. T3-bin4]|nr:deoxyhypusine synthase [Tolypothrix sp. T3-bin4]
MSKQLGQKISPTPMSTNVSVVDLIDNYFTAYNSARLREICQLLSKDVLTEGVT